MNEFETRLKKMEQELTDLKTAAEYTAVRSAVLAQPLTVSTGLYRVQFEMPAAETLLAFAYCGLLNEADVPAMAYPRTPEGTTVVVEVDTHYTVSGTGQTAVGTAEMRIVANWPVVSIERVSE